jgi:general secretion pathway protein G
MLSVQALANDLAFSPYRLSLVKLSYQRSAKGLTLIELLIVVLIVGILTAISLPAYIGWIDKTQYAKAKTQMNCTAKELQVIKLETGVFPPDTPRDVPPSGVTCFYLQSSGTVPFNSKYDYENWSATGGCYIQITFLGKDGQKQYPNGTPLYNIPGIYEYDDLAFSLGIQVQTSPCN